MTEEFQPLAPVVDDIGIAVIEHGERGYDLDPEHPEACLCGKVEPYYLCDGPGVESLTIRAADFGRSDEQGCLLRSEGTCGQRPSPARLSGREAPDGR